MAGAMVGMGPVGSNQKGRHDLSGGAILSKLESHKKHIKIGEIGEKTLRKRSQDLTLAMSRSKQQHQMT